MNVKSILTDRALRRNLPFFAGPTKFINHYGDLSDSTNLVYIIAQVQPTEVYNLGAQSHVKVSFEMAEYTVSRPVRHCRRRPYYSIYVLRETLMLLAPCDCLTLFEHVVSRNIFAFIKRQLQSSMEKSWRHHSRRRLRSTHALRTVLPNFMLIGSRSTTVRPTASTPAMAFYSITRARGEDAPS